MSTPPENGGEPNSQAAVPEPDSSQPVPFPQEIDKLPPEMAKTIMVSVASFLKTGQDPDTAKLAAQAEMHEESCHLEAYKENLKNRDQQNTRDHAYRMKRLNHDTIMRLMFATVCVVGLVAGFYVYRRNPAPGSTIMTASFMSLLYVLTGKSVLHRDQD